MAELTIKTATTDVGYATGPLKVMYGTVTTGGAETSGTITPASRSGILGNSSATITWLFGAVMPATTAAAPTYTFNTSTGVLTAGGLTASNDYRWVIVAI